MVKAIEKQGKKFYQCEDCKLLYEDKDWAEKWCKKTKSCNIEITGHAIKKLKGGEK